MKALCVRTKSDHQSCGQADTTPWIGAVLSFIRHPHSHSCFLTGCNLVWCGRMALSPLVSYGSSWEGMVASNVTCRWWMLPMWGAGCGVHPLTLQQIWNAG